MGISQRAGISISDAGIPTGGTAGQALIKVSSQDYDVDWGAGGGSASGADGSVQFATAGAFDSDSTKLYYDKANKRLGVGTDAPDSTLHVVGEAYVVPDYTGTISLSEVSSPGVYFNQGLTHTYSAYCYKVIGGKTIYSANPNTVSYTDDNGNDHFYSVAVDFLDNLPSGVDGLRIFLSDTNDGYYFDFTPTGTFIDDASGFTAGVVSLDNFPNRAIVQDADLVVRNDATEQLRFNAYYGTFTTSIATDSNLSALGNLAINGTSTFTGNVTLNGISNTFNNTSTFSGLANFANKIRLTGATSNYIHLGAAGTASPSANSLGQKIQLQGTVGTVGVADYALGIESGFMWHTSGGGYKWYNNAASQQMALSSTGQLTVKTLTSSTASAASTPTWTLTGGWFTGGTATTTKPHILIEPAGATSTAWSTSGTGFGVNAASGFVGRLMDLQLNGATKLNVDYLGNITSANQVAGASLVANSIGGVSVSSTGVNLASSLGIRWYSGNWTDTLQTRIRQSSSGVLDIDNGTNGTYKDLRMGALTCSSKTTYDSTITAAGTTGAQTINKPSGTVNFAAAATSLVVTNSLVTTSSIVMCVVRTNDATADIKNVVPAAGSFTINLGAAAAAETSVGFIVYN